MEAVVNFHVGEKKRVMLVPKDAVVTSGTQRIVYVVNDEKIHPVSVSVTGYYGNDAAVEGDLKSGQQVVTRGNERLRPGQAVKVID
jgi:multidrug efflux pump subunit AcrA (membrane-fusion protein)